MSAIQAAILSPTYNERRVARGTNISASASSPSAMGQSQGRSSSNDSRRGGEMTTTVAIGVGGGAGGVLGAEAATGGGGGYSTQMRRNSIDSSLSKLHPKRPVIDLAVAIVAIPTLIIFALMLETNLRENWAETEETRWTVLGIGLAMIIISLLLCGYVTHRMGGVCLWAGPQEDPESYSNFNGDPSSLDIYSIGQDHYPPSYESVIEYDDLSSPPPPYDHVVHECIVVLDKTTTASSSSSPGTETKKYPVTVQLIDERQIANYI